MNHQHWFQQAAGEAQQASCHKAKCGCVIVAADKIIGAGYNSPPLNSEANRRCDRDSCCIHAEWRAIIQALKHHSDLIVGSTLYFTRVDEHGSMIPSGKPYCTVCSRLALDVGIHYFALWHEEGITIYPTETYNQISCDNHET